MFCFCILFEGGKSDRLYRRIQKKLTVLILSHVSMYIIFKFQRRKLFLVLEGWGIKVPRSKEMCISSWYISRNIMAQWSICKHLSLSSNMFQRGCTSYYLNHSRLESLWYYISTNICACLNFSLFGIYGLESHLGFNLRLIV